MVVRVPDPRSRRRYGPTSPTPSARNSVRTALWALRRAFGDHADAVFDTSRNRIGLDGVEIDLRRFDELVGDDRIDEALALGSGELLAGLNDEGRFSPGTRTGTGSLRC
jgi:DNA-binding SARP family transcriptional activator